RLDDGCRCLGYAEKTRRKLRTIAFKVGLRDRRIETAVDSDGCEQRMPRVLAQALPGELRLRAPPGVDDARPVRKTPGAGPEEDARRKPSRDHPALRVLAFESLYERGVLALDPAARAR